MFVVQNSNDRIEMKSNEQCLKKYSMLSLKKRNNLFGKDDMAMDISYHFERCTTIVFNFATL